MAPAAQGEIHVAERRAPSKMSLAAAGAGGIWAFLPRQEVSGSESVPGGARLSRRPWGSQAARSVIGGSNQQPLMSEPGSENPMADFKGCCASSPDYLKASGTSPKTARLSQLMLCSSLRPPHPAWRQPLLSRLQLPSLPVPSASPQTLWVYSNGISGWERELLRPVRQRQHFWRACL